MKCIISKKIATMNHFNERRNQPSFFIWRKNMTKRKIMAFMLAFLIIVESFVQCSISVYASSESSLENNYPFRVTKQQWIENMQSGDIATQLVFVQRMMSGLFTYLLSQIGATVTLDFEKWLVNKEEIANAFDSAWFMIEDEDKLADDDYIKNIKVSAEGMTWLKNAAKQYADENEPYRIMSSAPLSAIPYSSFNYQKNVYDTIKNLMSDSTYGKGMDFGANPIGYDSNSKRITSVTVSYYLNPSDISYVSTGSNYDAWKYKETWGYSWSNWSTQVYQKRTARIVLNEDDEAIQSLSEFEAIARSHKDANNDLQYLYINYPDSTKKGTSSYSTTNFNNVNTDRYDFGSYGIKVTPVAEHYRVYTTVDDFIDYTLNRRKIYYTSDWYNKEPGAVTVDLSEVQDSLDDIGKALQELIEQIKNDTSEDDIEKLLQEILDELRNGGGGSGGGSGGGESGGGIEYDDSNLLSLLSGYFDKVLSYLKQLVDKDYTQTVQDSGGWLGKIHDKMDDIIKQLKSIKRWTIADTIADGAGAVADWASLIGDILSDKENGVSNAISTVSSALSDTGDLLRSKFPFCLPWDILLLITVFAAEPETPYFEIPIQFDVSLIGISVDYTLVVDFGQYEYLSKISRTVLAMTYAVGLIKMTFNVVMIKKEE